MNKNNPERSMMYMLGIAGLSNILSDGLIGDEEYTSLMGKISEGLLKADGDRKEGDNMEPDNPYKQEIRYYLDGTECPIWEKKFMSIEEASQYFGIGTNKLREMTAGDYCDFVVWNGSRRLIKKDKFVEYLNEQFSV